MKSEYIGIVILLVIVLLVAILVYLSQGLLRKYKREIKNAFLEEHATKEEILTQKDLLHLPMAVQKYLTYVGVVGKEKVHSFKMTAEGEIKMTMDSAWSKIKVDQNNFVGNKLVRLFFLRMNMFGIPVYALHSYTDREASMLGKIAGFFTVINAKGKEMRISDTITLLNDMCLIAPATLIDRRITWEEIDEATVKAIFTTEYCTVSAILYFNNNDQLINFTTEERYYAGANNTYETVSWSTPFYEYKEMNGLMLPKAGEATWNLPDKDYTYCKFTDIKSVVYNMK